jgi:IS30 family transposase
VDHQSLVNIRKNINLKTSGQTRVRKAFATVLDYPNLKIFYVPGESQIINTVDYISRHAEFVIREIDPLILHPKRIEVEEIEANQVMDITEIGKHAKEIDVEILKKEQKSQYGEILKGTQGIFKVHGKKEYIIQNDLLFEKVKSGAVLLLIPDCLADEIIQFIHVSALHASREEIFRKLRAQKILIKDRCARVHRLLKHCVYCKIRCTTKHSFEKQEFPREPALKCREKIHVDCLSIRTGDKENIFLTMVDEFSRRLFVHKLKNKKSETLVPILVIQLAEIGGSYGILISDNGREFLNKAVHEALLTLNILTTTNSPYNSRSNLCERAHKNIREKLRCTDLTASNVEFKTLLAVSFLNHCPQKELNFLSPNKVWANLDPPNYLPQFTREEVTILPTEKISFLEELQTQVMSEKIGRYLFKTEVLEKPFSEGDIVMLRDPVGISANKIKGPFRVIKTGLKSSVTILDINNGVQYRRNGRHLFKIYVSKEDMEKFMGKGRTVLENKRNGELEAGYVGSPLDNMSIKFPEPFEAGFKLRSGRRK